MFVLSGFSLSYTHAQTPPAMEVSKQQFIDMSLNMAEKAAEMQTNMKSEQRKKLREQLGEEEFAKFDAENKAAELDAEKGLAECLGITHSKLKSFEKSMGVDFQVQAIEQCKSKLPEKVDMSGGIDPFQNPKLSSYVACMEELAVEQTGVPAARIKSCAAAQTQ